jgi:hypothetical protein
VVEKMARRIKKDYSDDLFDTRPFADLAYVASEAAHANIPSLAANFTLSSATSLVVLHLR